MYGSQSLRTICAAILLGSLTSLAGAAGGDAEYEAGLREAQELRYARALDHFNMAAAQGHRDALRTAGLMLLYGQDLYGEEVQKDWITAVHLLAEAAAQGCAVSARVLRQIGHQRFG
jgi:TPR repeat protein